MRSINLRIAAGSRTVAAFGALKQFDPTRLLGPTLALLRAGDPLTIDLTGAADAFGCLERVLELLDQLDELQIPYEIDILVLPEDADYDREAGPVWVLRRVTKAQFAAAAADWRPRSARVPEAPPESPASALNDKIRRLRSILDERWQRLGFEALLPAEQDYILIWGLNAEVSSGTFDQYLCNSSGDRAQETAAALRRAGAEIVLAILEELLRAIPGGWCADREERWRRMDAMSDREAIIRKLTDEYYEAIEVDSDVCSQRLYAAIETAYTLAGIDVLPTSRLDTEPAQ